MIILLNLLPMCNHVFPENADVLTAKNSLLMIRKANPKMIIKIWKLHI